MSIRGEVLVAIMNNKKDFAIARTKHWYRIPVSSVDKWLKDRWPPEWLAFYQTKIFGSEAYAVNYFAKVDDVRKVYRRQLFPEEPHNPKSDWQYYQLILNPLQKLPEPILSRRWRRIVFIPSTWQKFMDAVEINDLYDGSPLEDRLWVEFKRYKISAERQEFITVNKQNYALDFAIYCVNGDIDVETDGDTWHANPEKAKQDNLRDNALQAVGWNVLHFTTHQIQEETAEYCIHEVVETINNLGGVDEDKKVARKIGLKSNGSCQLDLFDDS